MTYPPALTEHVIAQARERDATVTPIRPPTITPDGICAFLTLRLMDPIGWGHAVRGLFGEHAVKLTEAADWLEVADEYDAGLRDDEVTTERGALALAEQLRSDVRLRAELVASLMGGKR